MSVLISWQTSTNTWWQVFTGGCVHAHVYIYASVTVWFCVCLCKRDCGRRCVHLYMDACVCVCVCMLGCVLFSVIDDGQVFFAIVFVLCVYILGGCFVTFFFSFRGGGGGGHKDICKLCSTVSVSAGRSTLDTALPWKPRRGVYLWPSST